MSAVRFTLDGQRFELTHASVESRLRDEIPEPVHKHAVRIINSWWPVMQAFEAATDVPRSQFSLHTARRHLAALGFEVRGEIEPRTASINSLRRVNSPVRPGTPSARIRPGRVSEANGDERAGRPLVRAARAGGDEAAREQA